MPEFVDRITTKLKRELNATQVEIIDDSWKHAGHAGNQSGFSTGTHLQISIESELFRNMPLMDQHRLIHNLLKEEMATRIHALTLKTTVPSVNVKAKA